MNVFILTGFTLGLLSSLHCVGMCGPIALSLPVHQYTEWKKTAGILLYNLGRIFSYGIFGIIFGFIGQSLYFANFQQYFSIVMGSIILIFILNNYFNFNFFAGNKFQLRFIQNLKSKLSIFLQKRKIKYLFVIGILNGFLPCGMVYMALAASAATGSFFTSTLFMLAFGVGTAPLMYAVVYLGKYISNFYRSLLQKSVPVLLTLMALLLIVRGSNLGIPYLSPRIEIAPVTELSKDQQQQIIKCPMPASAKNDN